MPKEHISPLLGESEPIFDRHGASAVLVVAIVPFPDGTWRAVCDTTGSIRTMRTLARLLPAVQQILERQSDEAELLEIASPGVDVQQLFTEAPPPRGAG